MWVCNVQYSRYWVNYLINETLIWKLKKYYLKSTMHSILPSSLQRLMLALKVRMEKSMVQSTNLRSGNWILSCLCIGVKWMMASAVMLYWSNVHRVWSNQIFFSGHHSAWSDQSIAISEWKQRRCCYKAAFEKELSTHTSKVYHREHLKPVSFSHLWSTFLSWICNLMLGSRGSGAVGK